MLEKLIGKGFSKSRNPIGKTITKIDSWGENQKSCEFFILIFL